MKNTVLIFFVLLIIITLSLIGLSFHTAFRKRKVPSGLPFSFLLCVSALYAGGYAGELVQTTVEGARFWLHIQYLGIPLIPLFWVMTVCEHTDIRINKKYLYLPLLAEALITFTAEQTNSWHGLYYSSVKMVFTDPFTTGLYLHGPLYWFHIVFQQSAMIFGAVILIQHAWGSPKIYKIQSALLSLGAGVPLIGNIVYLAGFCPFNIDIAPFTLAVSSGLFYLGFFVFRYFEISPIARMYFFDSIRDAALVIDPKNRILDFNVSAKILFPHLNESLIGKTTSEVFLSYPNLVKILNNESKSNDLVIEQRGRSRCYELIFSPVMNGKIKKGISILFSEVTERLQLLEEVRRLAELDPLTGAANRRRFNEMAMEECLRSSRTNSPFSILLIDLDHFKIINDTLGHAAGDEVLKSAVMVIKNSLRTIDMYARYGGEEFVILLPATSAPGALKVAERIRESMENDTIISEGARINYTASTGVICHAAASAASLNLLLSQADKALYRAKARGRNCVELAAEIPSKI